MAYHVRERENIEYIEYIEYRHLPEKTTSWKLVERIVCGPLSRVRSQRQHTQLNMHVHHYLECVDKALNRF